MIRRSELIDALLPTFRSRIERPLQWSAVRALQPIEQATPVVMQALIDPRARLRWTEIAIRTFPSGLHDGINYWRVAIKINTAYGLRTTVAQLTTQEDGVNVGTTRATNADERAGVFPLTLLVPETTWGDQVVYVEATTIGAPSSLGVVVDMWYLFVTDTD